MKTAVFDARSILLKPSGIGVYARELALALPTLLPDFRFVFLVCEPSIQEKLEREMPPTVASRVSFCFLPYSFGSLKNQLFLPSILKKLGCDLYHAPNFFYPYLAFRKGGKMRCIATIHDVIPLLFRDFAPGSRTAKLMPLFRAVLKLCVRHADMVVTVSECSRRDIISELKLSPKDAAKIKAVHNGVDAAFRSQIHDPLPEDPAAERSLLYVGRMDPYKNVPLLVEAFHKARSLVPFPLKLRIVGPLDDRYPQAPLLAKELHEEEHVEFLGSVPFQKLLELYRSSTALVHPARYEGFGLQLAEAMQSGLPVICSDGGSVPEIVGHAARVVPLSDGSDALAAAIAETLSSPSSLLKLQSDGLAHGARYTWQKAAAQIAELYKASTRQ